MFCKLSISLEDVNNRLWQCIILSVYQPQLFCFGWYKMFLKIDAAINNRCSK